MLSLELALIRWSVVHLRLSALKGGPPELRGFLAGWFCREIGATEPEDVGMYRDSWRMGCRKADDQIAIIFRMKDRS